MSLGTNTPWHRNVSRIHTTTHPSLGSEIITCHALRLHPWHANHRHWPRSRSTWHNMGPRHAPRNRIPWWYLVKPTKLWQEQIAEKCTFTMKRKKRKKPLLFTRVVICQSHGMQLSKCIWRRITRFSNLTREKRCRQIRGRQHPEQCIMLKTRHTK